VFLIVTKIPDVREIQRKNSEQISAWMTSLGIAENVAMMGEQLFFRRFRSRSDTHISTIEMTSTKNQKNYNKIIGTTAACGNYRSSTSEYVQVKI